MEPEHLLNLLERRAKTVVYRMWTNLPHRLEPYWREDLLQIAKQEVAKTDFLENFRYGGPANLYLPTLISYTDRKLRGILIDFVREVSGIETLGRSDLGVLARYSKKITTEALKGVGYSQEVLNNRIIAWQCFREFRQSCSISILNFELQQFQEIANLYELRSGENVSPETLKQWLHQIARAVRHLLDGRKISFEQVLEGNNTKELQLLNNTQSFTESLEEESLAEFKNLISQKLSGFEENAQQILFLTYSLGMSQMEVAQKLSISQSTVCRQLQRLLTDILKELCLGLKISPITSERLGELNEPLKEFLESYYQQQYNPQVNRID